MALRPEVRDVRSKLQVGKAPPLTDPLVSKTVEVKNRPKIAQPTTGPQRLTSFVPFDATVLSLGQKCPDADRINDIGITGRTKRHVHFHVSEGTPTLISLGGSATSVTGFGLVGGASPATEIGYMMSTCGVGWQEAAGQHYLTSSGGDVIVRAAASAPPPGHAAEGKHVVVQSDHGFAEVNAQQTVNVSAGERVTIAAGSYTLETHGYNQPWVNEAHAQHSDLEAKTIAKYANVIQSFYGLTMAGVKIGKKVYEHKVGWVSETLWDVAKFSADIAKLYGSISRLRTPNEPGQVKVTATTDASVTGGRSASLFGFQAATVTSAISATVIGGTASMKGLYTSVWAGIDASLKAVRSVSVESEWSKAKLSSRTKTEVKSDAGCVLIQGETYVQMASKSQGVGIYGEGSAWIGSGDEGYAMSITPTDVTIAKITSDGKKLKESGLDGKHHLMLNSEGWAMAAGDSTLMMSSQSFGVSASSVSLEATSKNFYINGKRINIG